MSEIRPEDRKFLIRLNGEMRAASGGVEFYGEPAITLNAFASRMRATEREMVDGIAKSLYADNEFMRDYVPPPYTLRDRLRDYAQRCRDAWEVLRGCASIDDR